VKVKNVTRKMAMEKRSRKRSWEEVEALMKSLRRACSLGHVIFFVIVPK
jgi:hypothetical protein